MSSKKPNSRLTAPNAKRTSSSKSTTRASPSSKSTTKRSPSSRLKGTASSRSRNKKELEQITQAETVEKEEEETVLNKEEITEEKHDIQKEEVPPVSEISEEEKNENASFF